MTVQELISYLEDCDRDAEVRIMSQSNYPFENSIEGVVVREEFMGDDELPEESAENDVFLCEGEQLGYGSRAAWDHC